MNKVAKRLFTFFIGVPLVIFLVFIDYLNHLPLQVLFTIFSIVGANELYEMFMNKHEGEKSYLFPREIILIFSGFMPFVSYIFVLSGISLEITPWIFVCEVIVLMAGETIAAKTFEKSASKIVNSIFIIFYCGFLFTFLSRMTILEHSREMISLYLLFVFICDSAAWLFGILFGNGNRGIIAASPNKSIAGFIGGIAASMAIGALFKFVFPEIITCSYGRIVILGFITALSAIFGDLIESVLKRSCGVKDSGNIIPGRGGVLDSVDSLLIAAPIFYIGQHFLL